MNIFLGGWYLIDEPDIHHGEKARVISINYDSNYVTMLNCREFEVCKDDLRPIPLTGEYFIDLHWELIDTDTDDGANCFGREMPNGTYLSVWEPKGTIGALLSIEYNDKRHQTLEELKIDYLHELQLYMMACGDEGKINVIDFFPPWEKKVEQQQKQPNKKKKKHNKRK